jgi:hydrogenase maturation protease
MTGLLDNTLVGEPHVARPEAAISEARVLVLGVGNLLMGDEGVGVHVLRLLEKASPLDGVRLLDGGTGGINLLLEFDGMSDIVLIDATRDGKPAGTVTFLQPRNLDELPRGLGAHDFGLKDLFAVSALSGRPPSIHLFTISVEEIRPMSMELSHAVAAAVPEVARAVSDLAGSLTSP